ncbi:MAG: DUF3793 family protein [Lachnospiraceae bacterium]|nr:DUF3793 family protein [Lachnospiraceae bacterium]
MSEQFVIEHCSPTLAGIKTGNLFSVRLDETRDINQEVRDLNGILKGKGLRVIPLKRTQHYALIYVYRPGYLRRDLSDPKAVRILQEKGYSCHKAECCITQLVGHLAEDEDFPHEIGLFLGYPPSDVECFIKNPCDGVKCSGCWKAYSDKEAAEREFKKYKKCTAVYRELNRKGRTLAQLAVATNAKRAER